MKAYEWILFDADETLFHFDAFSGLQQMFTHYGVTFTQQDYLEYQTFNKALWQQYERGAITAYELQHQRFSTWATKLQMPAQVLSAGFMTAMAAISRPLEGALSLLNTLKGKAKLGIITNGFTELQQVRLERAGLKNYFDILVISEQVGIPKPHPGIFEHALAIMGNPAKEKVLMVGDNPETDILGGINAGLDTCWLNAHGKEGVNGIIPDYQVASLGELERMLLAVEAL